MVTLGKYKQGVAPSTPAPTEARPSSSPPSPSPQPSYSGSDQQILSLGGGSPVLKCIARHLKSSTHRIHAKAQEPHQRASVKRTVFINNNIDIAERASAVEMIERYAGLAVYEADHEIDCKIAANDLEGALAMDRVRREVLRLSKR